MLLQPGEHADPCGEIVIVDRVVILDSYCEPWVWFHSPGDAAAYHLPMDYLTKVEIADPLEQAAEILDAHMLWDIDPDALDADEQAQVVAELREAIAL